MKITEKIRERVIGALIILLLSGVLVIVSAQTYFSGVPGSENVSTGIFYENGTALASKYTLLVDYARNNRTMLSNFTDNIGFINGTWANQTYVIVGSSNKTKVSCHNITDSTSDLCTLTAAAGTNDTVWNLSNLYFYNDSNRLTWNETKGNQTYVVIVSLNGSINIFGFWNNESNITDMSYFTNKILSSWPNITGRPTDLSNFSNSMRFFTNLTNFTGTLTNDQICIYRADTGVINCTRPDSYFNYKVLVYESNISNLQAYWTLSKIYIYNNSGVITFNETKMNDTIGIIGNNTYVLLTNYAKNNRTALSNFTNDINLINGTWSNTTYVNVIGDTMTGTLNMSSNMVTDINKIVLLNDTKLCLDGSACKSYLLFNSTDNSTILKNEYS